MSTLTEWMKTHPQVTYLTKTKSKPCQGYNYNKRRPCTKTGYWKFRARRLKHQDAKSGIYCWSHLFAYAVYTNGEYSSFTRWWDKTQGGEAK